MRTLTSYLARAVAMALLLVALTAGAVSAHGQTVDPNGNRTGFTKPISNPWARAHCHAQSPLVLATTAAHAANSFSPAGALPCPTDPGEGWPPGRQR
jgi:hypothetical protein